MVRVATHCTEADVSAQHIKAAREMGIDTVGFLMMSHMLDEKKLLEQAKLMVEYGATTVYATDSAGYLLPEGVYKRIESRFLSMNTNRHGFYTILEKYANIYKVYIF